MNNLNLWKDYLAHEFFKIYHRTLDLPDAKVQKTAIETSAVRWPGGKIIFGESAKRCSCLKRDAILIYLYVWISGVIYHMSLCPAEQIYMT